jgi:putative transposase
MAIPQRTAAPGTFFVTSACWQKRRLFQVERNAALFLERLEHYRTHFWLHAFVVMPDHVHLLITPREMVTLERAMQYVKGGFSRQIESKMPVWQKSFADHRIRNAEEYATRVEYIHQNPVRARLVERAEEYAWSSAAGKLRLDMWPVE